MTLKVVTHCREETVALGARIGRLLAPGDVVLLYGELGTGKTQFAKGIAEGLAVPADTPVTSPTYTILNIYEGRLPLYHFDLYRLSGAEEVSDLGFDEYFGGAGVCVVEWPERFGEEVPVGALSVSCLHAGEDEREISFAAGGERARLLLEELSSS